MGRAPDSSGEWLVSFRYDDAAITSPLHVLGESTDFSPMMAREEDCTVVFAGTLYNSDMLCRASCQHSEATPTVSTVLVRAYQQWGEKVLEKLRGIFVIFIWDAKTRTLLCARDPMGIAPLFYARAGHEWLFSSSQNALLQHPHVSRTVNRAALADHLCHRWPKLDETFWVAVNRVPPGHVLRVTDSAVRASRYWDPAPVHTPMQWIHEEELEQFDVLFQQAVTRCLENGPTAIYLSGGLDSVSVAAIATRQCREQGMSVPLALSLAFPDAETNEEHVQRGVAHHLGLPQVMATFAEAVGRRGLVNAALEVSRTQPAPLLNTYGPAYHFLGMEGKRRGCQTILTGSGGDEWLSVSPYYAADLLRSGEFSGLYTLWQSRRRSYPLSGFSLLRNLLWTCGTRTILVDAVSTLVPSAIRRIKLTKSTPAWVAPDPALRQELAQRMDDYAPPYSGSFYQREMRRGLDHPLVSWEFEENWETGRRLGVTILSPFFDADLVGFLYRVPPALLNRGGSTKGLVRQTVAEQFPGLGFERQKKVVATNFFTSCMLQEGSVAVQALGNASALEKLGIVDSKRLCSLLEWIITQRRRRQAFRIWDVLNLETWVRAQE